MGKLDNLRNKPFLLISVRETPAKGVSTNKSGWNDKGTNIMRYETPTVVDRVTTKHLSACPVIIDIMAGKCVVNRYEGAADDGVAEHYLTKFSDICKRGSEAWVAKYARTFIQEEKARGNLTQAAIDEFVARKVFDSIPSLVAAENAEKAADGGEKEAPIA